VRSAWLLTCLLATPGSRIDSVVAVVDKDVITESELLTEARIALAWREGERAATAELSDELLEALRDYLIDQTLVASQARRLGAEDVPEEAIDQRAWQFTQRFSSQNAYRAFLRRFGITEAAVRDILARDLRNDRYIAQRMRTRLLGGASREGTPAARYDAAVKQWLQELRQSVELRRVGPDHELELDHH
jgi:hypothetical protein